MKVDLLDEVFCFFFFFHLFFKCMHDYFSRGPQSVRVCSLLHPKNIKCSHTNDLSTLTLALRSELRLTPLQILVLNYDLVTEWFSLLFRLLQSCYRIWSVDCAGWTGISDWRRETAVRFSELSKWTLLLRPHLRANKSRVRQRIVHGPAGKAASPIWRITGIVLSHEPHCEFCVNKQPTNTLSGRKWNGMEYWKFCFPMCENEQKSKSV